MNFNDFNNTESTRQALTTTENYGNVSVTGSLSYCQQFQPNNPYCGVFGIAEQVEVVFLCVVILVGTFGNLLVICSIIYDKRLLKHGNVFIINLAVADLIVCGFFLPTVIANVIKTENALPMVVCQFAGYMITVTAACSVSSLAFIALNRYWSVAHSSTYARVFSKVNSVLMVFFTWFWSNLIVSPTLYGVSSLIYDEKMAECGWDDQATYAYNVALIVCAIFIPVCVIIFCYWNIFFSVRKSDTRIKRQSRTMPASLRQKQDQAHYKRETTLLKTLAVTIFAFLICWLPYGTVVLFFADTVPPRVKKAAARFGLSNSAINFIIYGAMNTVYRRGYKRFLSYLCGCKKSYKWLIRKKPKKEEQDAPFRAR